MSHSGAKRRRLLRATETFGNATAIVANGAGTASATAATGAVTISIATASESPPALASASASASMVTDGKDKSMRERNSNQLRSLESPLGLGNVVLFDCTVCWCLISGRIYQCSSGHIFCSTCYTHLQIDKKCRCPTCRVRMTRHTQIRNLKLESLRDLHRVPCKNTGCTMITVYKDLGRHKNFTCEFRSVCCKYEKFGCTWKGIAASQAEHEKACPISEQTGKTILQTMEEANKLKRKVTVPAQPSPFSNMTLDHFAEMEIVASMRDPCRNVEVVRCEMQGGGGCKSAWADFKFNSELWKIETATKNAKFGFYLVNAGRKILERYTLNIFVATVELGHPEKCPVIPPTFHKGVILRQQTKKGAFVPLPLTVKQGEALNAVSKWTLLLILVDKSSGFSIRKFSQKCEEKAQLSTDDSSNDDADDADDAPNEYEDEEEDADGDADADL